MTSHTRFAILGFTVGIRLIVRETVAIETFAMRAMVRMSVRSGLLRLLFFFACPVSAIRGIGNAFTAYCTPYTCVGSVPRCLRSQRSTYNSAVEAKVLREFSTSLQLHA